MRFNLHILLVAGESISSSSFSRNKSDADVMELFKEQKQRNYPGKRNFEKIRQLVIALMFASLVILQPFIQIQQEVKAEENKRIQIKSQEVVANHWRLSQWKDQVIVCDIYVAHDNQPSGKEIENHCGEDIYISWLTTPPCEAAISGGDVTTCKGFFIGYKGKGLRLVKETVELPQVNLQVEAVNCEPGGWCDERAIIRFIGEEPITDHKIISMHVKIGNNTKKCDSDVCELRMPVTNEKGVQVEFWAVSDFGDQSEINTFLLRNVRDKNEENRYRFDLLGTGLNVTAPAGTLRWMLLPTLNHPDAFVLEKPETLLDLQTTNRFLYLAGKLILTGIVNGETCSGFGLINNSTANPCGEELAQEKVISWQNQYNEDIYTASEEYNVPARLLKAIIAQETQFWPHPVSPKEFGLGRITDNGADMLLTWNLPIFIEECVSSYSIEACSSGYTNMDPDDQSLLRGLILKDVGTDQEVKLLAATLLASSYQVDQMVKNVTGLPVSEVSTYEEMWKLSVANYHAGSGCVGTAMQSAWDNGDNMIWELVYPNLLGDCMGAVGYVESVFSLAK